MKRGEKRNSLKKINGKQFSPFSNKLVTAWEGEGGGEVEKIRRFTSEKTIDFSLFF